MRALGPASAERFGHASHHLIVTRFQRLRAIRPFQHIQAASQLNHGRGLLPSAVRITANEEPQFILLGRANPP